MYVVKHGYFHHEVQKKIVDTMFDVGYSNESGLRELIDEAGSLMHEINLDGERKVMGRFLREIMEDHPKATYGEMMVRQALEQGAVETLLVSEGLRRSRLSLTCGACGESFEVTSDSSSVFFALFFDPFGRPLFFLGSSSAIPAAISVERLIEALR